MPKNKMMLLNPFRVMGYESDDIIPAGSLGAVAASAGVGKTALLVQLALNAMLRGKKVLHIGLQDPVNKVDLWYQELFQKIAEQMQVTDSGAIWEEIITNRFIMTFKVEVFNVPKLKERLTDLSAQKIFAPEVIIIDGLNFDEDVQETMTGIESMVKEHNLRAWFTIHVHSNEESERDVMPDRLASLLDMFAAIFKLQPEEGVISIKSLKAESTESVPLFLDPATMLIKQK